MSWQTSFTLHMPYMPLFLKWIREYIFMLIDELNWHNSVSEKLLGDVSVGKRIAYVKKKALCLVQRTEQGVSDICTCQLNGIVLVATV